MKKKKSGGGGANWMDTYGDMVTLLLCFFVLLYSMSTIDQEAWKNLVMSFNPYAVMSGEAWGNKGPSADPGEQGVNPPDMLEPTDGVTQNDIEQTIEQLAQNIQEYIENAGMASNAKVEMEGGRIFVNFKDTAFFNPNKYDLRRDSYPVLDALCEMLSSAAYAIDEVRVQGHTAEVPGSDPYATAREDRFLSGNRASSVVVYIQEHTDKDVLDPAKLISEGLGQWHPVDTNATDEGRANNRRVEMIISGRNLETELGTSIESYETET